ncbi:16S rRNA (guanine(527)-N(7))-methyltransferase RsmG [Kytococcus sp. Marseille-QA3725]
MFGDRLPQAEQFARMLATSGTERGLIGPREVPRLWDRHVLNCAVVAELLEDVPHVIDVGSGAGLPGIALALAAPETRLTLVEPMLRRTVWLEEVVAELGLGDQVQVVRSRAEDLGDGVTAPVVTARAVARLETLAPWTLPLVEVGGRLLALKGSSARQEVEDARKVLDRLGGGATDVVDCGTEVLEVPTTVVVVAKEHAGHSPKAPSRGRRRRTKEKR